MIALLPVLIGHMSKATPWMDFAKAELGTKEAPGSADNPKVVAYYAEAGHPEIHDDEVAWCAAFAGAMLRRAGYPSTGSLAARSYLTYGKKIAKPEPGCVVVFWRGSPSSWQGHVAFYVRDDGSHIRVLGGNQGNGVTEASYSKSQVLGYRMPVKPSVAALREAGSSEIKTQDAVQKGVVAVGGGTIAAEVVETVTPPPVVPTVDPSLVNLSEQFGIMEKLGVGANAVAKLIIANRLGLILAACAAIWLVARWQKRRRVAKAALGTPLGLGS